MDLVADFAYFQMILQENERDDKPTPLDLGGDFQFMTQRLRRRTRANRVRSDPGFTKSIEEELFGPGTPNQEFSPPSNDDENSPNRVRINSFLYPRTDDRRRRRTITIEPDSVDKTRNDDIRERIRRYKESSDIDARRKQSGMKITGIVGHGIGTIGDTGPYYRSSNFRRVSCLTFS